MMLAQLFSAVVLGALPAQEQAALLAVVCRLAILIALLAHELRLPHPHALHFNPRQQHKVELQRLHSQSADFATGRAGEPSRCCQLLCARHILLLLGPASQALAAEGVNAAAHAWRVGLGRLKRILQLMSSQYSRDVWKDRMFIK